tara:strand:- start:424 stop:639 length:216 start_codon:yes stop_codon:yes gene_type:complete
MLVLTRKEGARIIVSCGGVQIAVTVVDARSGSARLGVDAPDDVRVFREELVGDLVDRTEQESRPAAVEVGR